MPETPARPSTALRDAAQRIRALAGADTPSSQWNHPDVARFVADFLDQAALSAEYTTGSMPPFAAIALHIAAMFPPATASVAVEHESLLVTDNPKP